MTNTEAISPRAGAAVAVVPRYLVGMMFWIWGVPGSIDITKVATPKK